MAEENKKEETEECEASEEEKLDEEEIDEESKDDEYQQLEDQFMRLRADFSNYKRRTEESKQGMIAYALESFVKELLPILDDFERAMDSHEEKDESFYQGVELIYNQLNKVLESNNVEEIDALGEEFDPNKHHAVYMEESEDYDSNKVIEVLQKGYQLNSKVIRPAMVKVSK